MENAQRQSRILRDLAPPTPRQNPAPVQLPAAAAAVQPQPEPQGDAPRRISKCQSFCNCLGVGLINGFIKVPLSHGVGLMVALAGRSGTTDMAGASPEAATGLGCVAGLAGLGIGATAGYVAGDLVAHRLGLEEYRDGAALTGSVIGAMPAFGALFHSLSDEDPYKTIVLLTLALLFREVTQGFRDTSGNGVMMGVLPKLEVLDANGEPLSIEELTRFDKQRGIGSSLVYAGTSMAEKALLQDALINVFGIPQNYDFTSLVTTGLATSNSSLMNEVFDDVEIPLMLCALALARGYRVRWESGEGFTRLLQNVRNLCGSEVRNNIVHHAAMRITFWSPVELCVMASKRYAPGSSQYLNLRLLAGAFQGITGMRHNTVVYGEAGVRRRLAREASPV